MLQTQQWVTAILAFYRRFDFFSEHSALSDSELAALLLENEATDNYLNSRLKSGPDKTRLTGVDEMDEWLTLNDEIEPDMWLLAQDKSRVWWDDGEVDITPDSKTYETFFEQLSIISRGAWVVSHIQEIWQGDTLQSIEFRWGEAHYEVSTQEFYGWIDFEVLRSINELIQDSGYQFHTAPTGDQTTFIVALTEKEQKAFEERGWSFDEDE